MDSKTTPDGVYNPSRHFRQLVRIYGLSMSVLLAVVWLIPIPSVLLALFALIATGGTVTFAIKAVRVARLASQS